MKKSIIIIFAFVLTSICYAQVASIFGVDVQAFLRDEKNIIRYNPLNIFDDNPNTVFAVNKKSFTKVDPLIKIFFGNSISINEIRIKHGYFDKKYYKANYRIKSGEVVLWNDQKIIKKQNFFFTDEMTLQSISLDKQYEVSKIEIYITELFQYEKWDDIVISDIYFLSSDTSYGTDFGLYYTNTYKSYIEKNEYNEKGLLIYYRKDYPPLWGYLYKNVYDSNNRMILSWRDGGDGPGDTYILYEYQDMNSEYPSEIQKIEKIGDNPWKDYGYIINPYKFDKQGRVLEYENFDEKTSYTYNEKELVKVIKRTKNPDLEYIYYYQNGRIVLEEYSNWVYIYKYENEKLKYKIPVKTNDADVCFYEYFFNKNQLEKVLGYTHHLR